jgi:hypothetical protein
MMPSREQTIAVKQLVREYNQLPGMFAVYHSRLRLVMISGRYHSIDVGMLKMRAALKDEPARQELIALMEARDKKA